MDPSYTTQVVDLAAVRERAGRRAAGQYSRALGASRPRCAGSACSACVAWSRSAAAPRARSGRRPSPDHPAGRATAGHRRPAVLPEPGGRPVARERRAARREPPLRLTRRGRVVVVAVAALVAAVLSMVAVPRASLAWASDPPRGHLVVAGESLWEVAVALDPDADTRVVVDRLMRINHLPAPDVTPGQFLLLD
ncbi:LysM peptidoglycan-binding domain-containing protein [Frankia sp. AgB32]|uniref:LysM peptidoglycan-binding domain-containing protein n=1 Tax=Frankia sp. AgB32 TaxID=631119 RepID=UPI00200E7EEB|nr:LysM peptidoglycan-binding domain-containing protein [Frankia sp. AgB32]MCK9895703.1 LysM peptidoglycan-binding domain-containing protein [Frankia sp. AgB32]